MRFIFGLIVGVVVTIGAFYIHDSRVAEAREAVPGVEPPAITEEVEIVNWDVLGRVTQEQVQFAREQFNKLVGN
jgi:hypothetical protein